MKCDLSKIYLYPLVVYCFAVIYFLIPQAVDAQETHLVSESNSSTTIILVPTDVPDIQSAIYQVPDGGIIEINSGTYYAPDNGLGFVINNLGKGFTIRATEGANVTLDGAGSRKILHFVNSEPYMGGWVVFEGITFANGYSGTDGQAGGMTMVKSQGTFVDCVFRNNTSVAPWTGGGGVVIGFGSIAFFSDSEWQDNTAKNYGAGMAIGVDSNVYLHNSKFINNRTNILGHTSFAAGGGIHVGNSRLYVSNSHFENNQAGYVGGAIYAIGEWQNPTTLPRTELIIANSTFFQNKAEPNNVQLSSPTEAGAVHVESQAYARIINSRFIMNSAETGGGVNLYQSQVEITDSVFLGNRAVGIGSENGFGAAISAISNDRPSDGSQNRPAANLSIKNSYFQGQYGSVGTVGQVGGGIYIAGDRSRVYGIGVSQMGTVAENRALLTIENVAIVNTDVAEIPGTPGTGFGGGILTDLANVTIHDSIISNSDAIGSTASGGGGLAFIHHSLANVYNSTIIGNSAGKYGGGVFIQGSEFNLKDSKLLYNEISPGVSESVNTSYGAAIFSSPDTSNNIDVTGSVNNCLIGGNIGLPLYDVDLSYGPINDLRYNNNQFYSTHFQDEVYSLGGITGFWRLNVDELNNAVIYRTNGTVTDKVQIPNVELATIPTVSALWAVPSKLLATNAVGDGSSQNPAYLVYAWSGQNSAQLDGVWLSSKSGSMATTDTGSHQLIANGQSSSLNLLLGEDPTVTLIGDDTELSWNVTQGTFLEGVMDQGILIPSTPSGTVSSGIVPNQVYRYYAITEEGGVMATYDNSSPLLSVKSDHTYLAGLNLEKNFGSFTIFNTGGCNMDWTASTTSPWVQILTESGSTTDFDSVWFELDVRGFSPGKYTANIIVDAGVAGSRIVQVDVIVVDTLHSIQLPVIIH